MFTLSNYYLVRALFIVFKQKTNSALDNYLTKKQRKRPNIESTVTKYTWVIIFPFN